MILSSAYRREVVAMNAPTIGSFVRKPYQLADRTKTLGDLLF